LSDLCIVKGKKEPNHPVKESVRKLGMFMGLKTNANFGLILNDRINPNV